MKRFILLLLLLSATAYAGVNNPTQWTEEDGSPSVYDPYQVKFSNGTVTNNGGGSISITTSGSGSSTLTVGSAIASGAANRVLYEDATNKLAESADFTFTGVTSQLAVTGTTTLTAKTGTGTPLIVRGASGQTKPVADFYGFNTNTTHTTISVAVNGGTTFDANGSSPSFILNDLTQINGQLTVNDYLNVIPDSTISPYVFVQSYDAAGSSAIKMYNSYYGSTFDNTMYADGSVLMATAGGVTGGPISLQTAGGLISLGTYGGGVYLNPTQSNSSFTVATDHSANMLFVDGVNDRVGIGTSTPSYPVDIVVADSGTPYYINTAIRPTGANKDVSVLLEATRLGTTQRWFFGAGSGNGTNNFRVYDLNNGFDALNAIPGSTNGLIIYGDSIANSSTYLGYNGSAVFNEQSNDADFRIESDGNANMFFMDASTNRVGIGTAAPTYTFDVTGSIRASTSLTSPIIATVGAAITGGTIDGTKIGASSASEATFSVLRANALNTNGVLISGTYTPTLTGVANVAASTAYSTGYFRVGNTVTVYGQLDVDPTLGVSTTTQLGVSIPVASNFTATSQVGGNGNSPSIATQSGGVYADATNDRAQLDFKAADPNNTTWYFNFSYQVL